MFCPQCGNEIPDDSTFCPVCGADLTAEKASEAQPTTPVPPVQPTTQMPPAAPQPQYDPYAQPAAAAPSPKKSRTGLIIVLAIVGVLLLCGCLAGGAFAYFKLATPKTVTETPAPSGPAVEPVAPDETAAQPGGTPEEAVDELYEAIASGDIERVRQAMTKAAGAGIQPEMFEGWDPDFSYRHVESNIDGDTATAIVQELGGGGLTGGTVTFKLANEDGWRIEGWESTALEGTDMGAVTLDETVAIDTVGRMLDALKGDRVAEVKSLVSPAYLKKDPTFARPSSEAFLSFELTGAKAKGDGFEVTSKEEWISGPETVYYTVVMVGDKPMVDDVRWP